VQKTENGVFGEKGEIRLKNVESRDRGRPTLISYQPSTEQPADSRRAKGWDAYKEHAMLSVCCTFSHPILEVRNYETVIFWDAYKQPLSFDHGPIIKYAVHTYIYIIGPWF
jgi:hypothetical protein